MWKSVGMVIPYIYIIYIYMESHKIPWFQSAPTREALRWSFLGSKNTPCPPPDWCQSSHRFRWTSDHPPTELCGRRPPKRWTMEYFHRASTPRCHDWQTRHGLMFKWVGNTWNDSVERTDLSNYQMFIEAKKRWEYQISWYFWYR